jgi:outer membrane protein TolC
MTKQWIHALAMSAFAMTAAAQELKLTLAQAIDSALANNHEVTMSRVEAEAALAKHQQTQSAYLPQVQVSYTALSTTNPLNAFGFKLQQEGITSNDFNPELLNNPGATNNFMTKLEVRQPLLNLDMLNMRGAAALEREVYTAKAKRTKEHITFEVTTAYAQAQLAVQQEEVMLQSLEAVKSIYSSAQRRFEQGYLQKSDLLQVQVQLISTERMHDEAKSSIDNTMDRLRILTGVRFPGSLQLEAPRTANDMPSINTIPHERADFQALQAAAAAQGKMQKATQHSLAPRVNAFGEYLLNDSEALGFGADAYLIGAQLSWTLFNGMTTRNKATEHKLQQQKIQHQLAQQKDQAQLELNKTNRQIENLRIALRQGDVAVEQSREAMRILNNRFEQGLVTTTDVLQGEVVYSRQLLQRAFDQFQFNTAVAYHHFLTTSEK